jgi:hypothetical protein
LVGVRVRVGVRFGVRVRVRVGVRVRVRVRVRVGVRVRVRVRVRNVEMSSSHIHKLRQFGQGPEQGYTCSSCH